MRDWAFITRPNNWEICRARLAFGLDAEYRETLSRYMAEGDRALVYVTSPVRGVAAVVQVGRVSLSETEDFGWTAADGRPKLFPDRVYWTPLMIFDPPLVIAPGSEFLNRLQFLPDKRRYKRLPTGCLDPHLVRGRGASVGVARLIGK